MLPMRSLADAGLVRRFAAATGTGGLQNYYKITLEGVHTIAGPDVAPRPRAFFAEISPSLFAHTMRLAEAIVETVRACHARRVVIERFLYENELVLQAGDQQVQPDCFFRLASQGRVFNLAFEIDNSTASVDSHTVNAIRRKLTVYHAYQELVLAQWVANGKKWERPRFRVVFLTPTDSRAYHILALAAAASPNPSRRLVLAATHDAYVTDDDPLFSPLFLDHAGHRQSLIDLHPTGSNEKSPVRLTLPVESPLGVCYADRPS